MPYQFLDPILPYAILIDLILIGILWLSTKPVKQKHQRIIYGLAVLAFIGFSFFKLLFTVPHPIASTPVDLEIRSNSTYTSLYYLTDSKNEPKVFWKDHIIGKVKEQSFDLENSLPDGLTIACKFDGVWYFTSIPMNIERVSSIVIEKSNFEIAQPEIINAIDEYLWTELGNYFSNFLTFLFIPVLIWRIKKYGF